MIKKTTIFTAIFISTFLLFGCNNDDDEPQPEMEMFLCCGDNPFQNTNVDNLDQSDGIINAIEICTPNGDAFNELFTVENIQFYPNRTVSIFDLNDNLVYESDGFDVAFDGRNQATNEVLEEGSYRYKIVIENENIFLREGYVCLVRLMPPQGEIDGIECLEGSFDPIINQ